MDKKLYNKSELMEVLEKFDFNFSKSLGQNFLTDKNILNKIIDNSNIRSDTNVLEIGPGAGTLSYELCKISKKVVSVEIDKNLIDIIKYNLNEFKNFYIINNDILKINLGEMTVDYFGDEEFIMVANLPYYITTPIIMKFLESDLRLRSMIITVQKEVADRIMASPGTKNYGALTVAVNVRADVTPICTVPPDCFVPRPKVSSEVLKIDISEKKKYPIKDMNNFNKTVKSIFSQRRKTLANSLSGSPFIKLSKTETEEILKKMGLDKKIRGEKLTVSQMAELSNYLFD